MSSNNEAKLKAKIVVVHIIRKNGNKSECLLLRRLSTPKGNWQMVSGKIEKGESAVEAAKRELFEETGLIADQLYSADFIETYFDARHDAIFMSPVFVAIINTEQNVKLSDTEHDQFKWLDIPRALEYLDFAGQRNALTHINERFLEREPSEYLLIR